MRRPFVMWVAAASLACSPVVAKTVVVTNAHLVTLGPAGEIESGTVVFRDGTIVAVGEEVDIPGDAQRVDARGMTVTPGLVASMTDLGLIEVRSVATSDDRAASGPGISAALDVRYALNPDSVLIPVARLGGITRASVAPGYADAENRHLQFAGQAALVQLGQDQDLLMRPAIAMVLSLGEDGAARAGSSRGAAIALLKATLGEVRDFARRRRNGDRGTMPEYGLSRADLEALIPVVTGEMPLIVRVSRASDIRQVLQLATDEGFKLILEGAEEGWRVGEEIAAAEVPVILNPVANTPMSFETLGATLENAARLHAAGVLIAIEGNGPHRSRETRYNAGNAVASGLPGRAALEAITINPARIFGVADRVGSLEPGKEADLVLWDGDPLEPMTRPVAIFIHGKRQPMTSRATELRDRYLPAVKSER